MEKEADDVDVRLKAAVHQVLGVGGVWWWWWRFVAVSMGVFLCVSTGVRGGDS
jgi:hypothetical protein